MPHVDDLASGLQTALNKNVVGPVRTEMILDESDKNIDLSDYIDKSGSLVITKRKKINPHGKLGRYTVSELDIKMIRNDMFNQNLKGETFYHATTRLYKSCGSAQSYIQVQKGAGSDFSVNDYITISDGDNSTTKQITGIVTTDANYDRFNFGSNVGTAYDGGSLVESEYLPGRDVVLRNKFDGVGDKVNQYFGVLKSYPRLMKDEVYITLQDKFRTLLEKNLRANSVVILTNSTNGHDDTIEYERASSGDDASTGTFDTDYIQIDESKCKIGTWNIRFTDATNFVVTDPDGESWTGDTSSNFYAGTVGDKQLSWLVLGDSTPWSGTFERHDEIEFKTVCSLGNYISSNLNTIPKMIYRLLIEDYGAGLATSALDTDSFDDLIADYDNYVGAISFTDKTTVLKAIELLQQHINATLFLNNDGKFQLSCYRPYQTPASVNTLSPDADIMEVEQDDLGRIERVLVYYDYDHDSGSYEGTLIVPMGASKEGVPLEIKLPAYHDTERALAKACGERIYLMWRRGMKKYAIKEKYNTGIAFDIDEIYQISSEHPEFGNRAVMIYEVKKDIMKCELEIMAYDLHFSFGNFAFCDVDDCDKGKVCW